MASYNTVPEAPAAVAEPLLQKPIKSSRKFIVLGVAVASFALGTLAVRAVPTKTTKVESLYWRDNCYVSGSKYSKAAMGNYIVPYEEEKCDGVMYYECLDCSNIDQLYLYYIPKFARWYIGLTPCSTTAVMHTTGKSSGSPRFAWVNIAVSNWQESDGVKFVKNDAISVSCSEADDYYA